MTNVKKYIVEDDAGTDIFRDLYSTPAEAIKAARADWEHLTASEQRSRRITVQEIVPEGIFADVLDPEELNEDGTPNLALDSVWLAASEAAKILWDSSKPETAVKYRMSFGDDTCTDSTIYDTAEEAIDAARSWFHQLTHMDLMHQKRATVEELHPDDIDPDNIDPDLDLILPDGTPDLTQDTTWLFAYGGEIIFDTNVPETVEDAMFLIRDQVLTFRHRRYFIWCGTDLGDIVNQYGSEADKAYVAQHTDTEED